MRLGLVALGLLDRTVLSPLRFLARFARLARQVFAAHPVASSLFCALIPFIFAAHWAGGSATEAMWLDPHPSLAARAVSLSWMDSDLSAENMDAPRLFYASCVAGGQLGCEISSIPLGRPGDSPERIRLARDRQISAWQNEPSPLAQKHPKWLMDAYSFVAVLKPTSNRQWIQAARTGSLESIFFERPSWADANMMANLSEQIDQSPWSAKNRSHLVNHLGDNWIIRFMAVLVASGWIAALGFFVVKAFRSAVARRAQIIHWARQKWRALAFFAALPLCLAALVATGGLLSEREALSAHPSAKDFWLAARPFEAMWPSWDPQRHPMALGCPLSELDGSACQFFDLPSADERDLDDLKDTAARHGDKNALMIENSNGLFSLWILPSDTDRLSRIAARSGPDALGWPSAAGWDDPRVRSAARAAFKTLDWSQAHRGFRLFVLGSFWLFRALLLFAAALATLLAFVACLALAAENFPGLAKAALSKAAAAKSKALSGIGRLEQAGQRVAAAPAIESKILRRAVEQAQAKAKTERQADGLASEADVRKAPRRL